MDCDSPAYSEDEEEAQAAPSAGSSERTSPQAGARTWFRDQVERADLQALKTAQVRCLLLCPVSSLHAK